MLSSLSSCPHCRSAASLPARQLPSAACGTCPIRFGAVILRGDARAVVAISSSCSPLPWLPGWNVVCCVGVYVTVTAAGAWEGWGRQEGGHTWKRADAWVAASPRPWVSLPTVERADQQGLPTLGSSHSWAGDRAPGQHKHMGGTWPPRQPRVPCPEACRLAGPRALPAIILSSTCLTISSVQLSLPKAWLQPIWNGDARRGRRPATALRGATAMSCCLEGLRGWRAGAWPSFPPAPLPPCSKPWCPAPWGCYWPAGRARRAGKRRRPRQGVGSTLPRGRRTPRALFSQTPPPPPAG